MVVVVAPNCSSVPDANAQRDFERQWLFQRQAFHDREGRKWWVFYTKSRQEKALARHLSTQRIPHYLPLYEKQSFIRGRRFSSLMPVFSGYVFLFADRDERVGALESNKVARTIAVPDSRQQELGNDLVRLQRTIESGLLMTIESQIRPGQLVRVKSGRLAGLEGVVTKRRGVTRLLVAVNYLQQGASVEIDDFMVEVI
jgi:transcriptional antiterminator RfaH